MKKIIALTLAAVLTLGLLAGCGKPVEEPSSGEELPEVVGTAEHLNVLLPHDASDRIVAEQADVFCSALRDALRRQGWEVGEITVSVAVTDAASGKALDDGTADVAILPASQYFTYNEDAKLLMTATRPGLSVQSTQASLWNGSADAPKYTNEDCPYSRTLICATASPRGRELAQAAKNGTLTWEMLSAATWLYPKSTDSSDFIYPDLWLKETFDKTMEDLPTVLTMDGYGALFAEAGGQGADVIVISADQRIDYAAAWQLSTDDIDYTGKMGFGHQDSIFNEIHVLGATAAIWGDVMALRTGDEPFNDLSFQAALTAAMDTLERNDAARTIWKSCGYTGFTPSDDAKYDNIRELTVFGAGD